MCLLILDKFRFVSKNRSYLFSQNSRLKTIDLYFTSSDLHQRYELKDTPNPQSVIFEKIFNEELLMCIRVKNIPIRV